MTVTMTMDYQLISVSGIEVFFNLADYKETQHTTSLFYTPYDPETCPSMKASADA